MTSTILDALEGHVHHILNATLSKEVAKRSRWAVIDYHSALLLGATHGSVGIPMCEYVLSLRGSREASVAGQPEKIPSPWAAYLNGVLSHSVELDDGHRFGTAHPAVAVIPAAMALAEASHASGERVLKSVVAGFEVMLRTAVAINPGHWHRGFHTTGTTGCLGAATAAAVILKLDRESTRHAISMSALQSAGLQQMLHSNPGIKPLQAGKAAMAGVISGEFAKRSIKSPENIFEGEFGYFKAMSGDVEQEFLIDKSEFLEIERTYFKFYPTCRHVHCSLDLTEEFLTTNKATIDAIDSIDIETYLIAEKEVGRIIHPKDKEEGMFSIPYAVAAMMVKRQFTLTELKDECLFDQDIAALAKKVKVKATDKWNSLYPGARGAQIEIRWMDKTWRKERNLPSGEPEVTTEEQILNKFLAACNSALPKSVSQRFFELVCSFDRLESVQEVCDIIRQIRKS